jgi:hypothetical protein
MDLLQNLLFKLNGGTTVIVDTSSFIHAPGRSRFPPFPVDMVDAGNENLDTILGGAAVVRFILGRKMNARSAE